MIERYYDSEFERVFGHRFLLNRDSRTASRASQVRTANRKDQAAYKLFPPVQSHEGKELSLICL